MKYIAAYNPQLKGRLGMKIYERLVENVCAVLNTMLKSTSSLGRTKVVLLFPSPRPVMARALQEESAAIRRSNTQIPEEAWYFCQCLRLCFKFFSPL